MSNRNK